MLRSNIMNGTKKTASVTMITKELVSCTQTFDKEKTSGEAVVDKIRLSTNLCTPIRSIYTHEYN